MSYYTSPRWSYELLDCAMPVSFDTYSNCRHKCLYCFSAFQRQDSRGKVNKYRSGTVEEVNVDKVKQTFLLQRKTQFSSWIAARKVVQWGGLADGFDYTEKERGTSLDLLHFFRSINYPISISTKATWFLDDPRYVEAIRGYKNLHMKLSVITNDDYMSRKIEPGVPSSSERIEAFAKLKELDIGGITLRFRPFILGCSDTGMEKLIERSAEAGIDSVTSEFLCIDRRSSPQVKKRYSFISDVIGFDIYEFYRKHSKMAGLMRLNYELKRKYFEEMRDLVHGLGLRFYVSDAHHKELSDGENCCGNPHTGELANCNRSNFMGALLIAKEKGQVTWDDIETGAEWMNEITYRRIEGYNQGNTRNLGMRMHQTMRDYMQEKWNDISSDVSPYKYFGGVLMPADKDEKGNVVYYYNYPLVKRGEHIKSVTELL